MEKSQTVEILPYPKEEPSFYCGEELHKAKQEKIQKLIDKWQLDGLLFGLCLRNMEKEKEYIQEDILL